MGDAGVGGGKGPRETVSFSLVGRPRSYQPENEDLGTFDATFAGNFVVRIPTRREARQFDANARNYAERTLGRALEDLALVDYAVIRATAFLELLATQTPDWWKADDEQEDDAEMTRAIVRAHQVAVAEINEAKKKREVSGAPASAST